MTVADPNGVLDPIQLDENEVAMLTGGVTVFMYLKPDGSRGYSLHHRGEVGPIEMMGMLTEALLTAHEWNWDEARKKENDE